MEEGVRSTLPAVVRLLFATLARADGWRGRWSTGGRLPAIVTLVEPTTAN
jgi:hypothetical protein